MGVHFACGSPPFDPWHSLASQKPTEKALSTPKYGTSQQNATKSTQKWCLPNRKIIKSHKETLCSYHLDRYETTIPIISDDFKSG